MYNEWEGERMKKDKMTVYSLPLQWLLITIVVSCIVGCNSNSAQRYDAVQAAFTERSQAEVKATSYNTQYIVRCNDGSIWEIKASSKTDGIGNVKILYKNCIFDSLYRVPEKPIVPPQPPLPLEKTDGTNSFKPTNFG